MVVVGAWVVVVVVVPPAQPVSVQASQQLESDPTQAEPFFGALHFVASLFVLHFVLGTPFLIFVTQQVTNPGLPQVDCAAHFVTSPLHCFGRVPAPARSFATPAAHFTYAPWLGAPAQSQSSAT